MKAWTSLTDTSVVKTYREVPRCKTTHFANSCFSEICCLATSLLVSPQRFSAVADSWKLLSGDA
jgi:hypothetical protein